MRHGLVLLALLVIASAGLAPAVADGNVNFILGGRGLDEDFWEPTEGQGAFGVNVDFGPEKWPVRIALGLSGSAAEKEDTRCFLCDGLGFGEFDLGDLDLGELGFGDVDFGDLDFGDLDFGDFELPGLGSRTVTSTVGELSAGVLYRPRGDRKLIPYVGGGLAFMTVEREIERRLIRISDDDTTVGIYVNGGVYWRIGKRFNIGFDGRIVTGTSVQLFGEKGDANYGQLGLILGFGF